MENIFVEFLPPWVETSRQPAFYDKESGTCLQQTARMYDRVNMLVRMFNKLSKQTKETVEEYIDKFNELSDKFDELHDYVMDYFANLDVQEEINNKLDAMLEDGTLGELIQNYLNLQLSYDTIDDLKADTAIGVGQRVTCYGSETINDGYGGNFIITQDSGDILLNNGLYATHLNNYLDNYIEGITYTRQRVANTDVYITKIPYNDVNGKRIDLSIGGANTSPREMPQEYARRNNTTLSINCSTEIYDYSTSTNYDLATFISNGEIILDEDLSGEPIPSNYVYIGFEDDRTVHEYLVSDTNGQQMLNDGCVTAFACYWKLVENSEALDLTGVLPGTTVVTDRNPRTAIGIKADKTLVILTCDGRTPESYGLTSAEMQQIFIEQGCTDAWNLDGGRSTSLIYKGTKINRDIADAGTGDVFINYMLDVKSPNRSKDLSNIYNQIGEIKNLVQDQLTESMIKNRDYSDKDLNTLSGQNVIGLANRVTNGPTNDNGYIINIPNPITENLGKFDKQIYLDSYLELMYVRDKNNGTWSEWQCINAKPSLNVYADDNSNTIVATHTYQTVTFPLKVSNGNVTRDMITIDDATKSLITVNKSCQVRFWFTATFFATSTGTKYVKLLNGDGYQVGPTMSVSATQGEIVPINYFFQNANYTLNGTTNQYHFQIYGEENDRLQRISCIIETDR